MESAPYPRFPRLAWTLAALLLPSAPPALLSAPLPRDPAVLAAELDALQRQMVLLQEQVAALRAELALVRQPTPLPPAAPTPAVSSPSPAPAASVATTAVAPTPAPNFPPMSSKFPVQFYGKIKFDALGDSINMGADEFILYIPRTAEEHQRYSFTARETRFGFALDSTDFGDWTTSARLETDFYGSAESSGSGSLRIRLAYLDLIRGSWQIRAGEDWVPIAALNPSTTNFTILGYNGNLWNRVPQVTVSRRFSPSSKGLLTAFRFRAADDAQPPFDIDIHLPWLGGQWIWTPTLPGSAKPAHFALGGAWRQGEINRRKEEFGLLSGEFRLPLSARFELLGEAYWGLGLGGEFLHKNGAITPDGRALETLGGFAQLGYTASPALRFYTGYGFDDPRDDDAQAGFYQRCSSLFANVHHDFARDLTLILEGTWVQTHWSGDVDQEGLRLQSSLVLVF